MVGNNTVSRLDYLGLKISFRYGDAVHPDTRLPKLESPPLQVDSLDGFTLAGFMKFHHTAGLGWPLEIVGDIKQRLWESDAIQEKNKVFWGITKDYLSEACKLMGVMKKLGVSNADFTHRIDSSPPLWHWEKSLALGRFHLYKRTKCKIYAHRLSSGVAPHPDGSPACKCNYKCDEELVMHDTYNFHPASPFDWTKYVGLTRDFEVRAYWKSGPRKGFVYAAP